MLVHVVAPISVLFENVVYEIWSYKDYLYFAKEFTYSLETLSIKLTQIVIIV